MPRIIHTAQGLVDQLVSVPNLPVRGLNTVAERVSLEAGGAVNVLVAAARSGAEAVHAGTVGEGRNGELIRAALATAGVTISSPAFQGMDTGICIVLLEPNAERTFITQQGAEREISVESLQSSEPRAGDYVCISGYTLQGKTKEPLVQWLNVLPPGVHVVLDPGAAFAELDEETQKAVLLITDIWTSNAQEAESLTGVAEMMDSAELVAELMGESAVAIVRDGPRGCAVRTSGKTTAIPGFPKKPIDTNGAGDAHTGTLVAELCSGNDIYSACRRANAAGAIKVTRSGPATAPTRAEIDYFLATQPIG